MNQTELTQSDADLWKEVEEAALKYDTTKSYEENEKINPDAALAYELVNERRMKEMYNMLQTKYASMGIKF